MPRKGPAPKREIIPDPVYNDRLVTRFINRLFSRGKKSVAEKIFYTAMENIGERSGREPLEVFQQAVKNTMPVVEVKPRRVGGATYQVPVEIRGDRRMSLGVRWLVQAARRRSGKSMSEKLAFELVDAVNGLGAAVKRRDDTHKMAEANKAFSHFKW